MRHVPSFLCLALGFALSLPAWGSTCNPAPSLPRLHMQFSVTMPEVPDDAPIDRNDPVRPTRGNLPTEVIVLPYMPPPGAWPQGFIRMSASTFPRSPEVQPFYVTVHNEQGQMKWHAVVELPRGHTRGVTMAHLAGMADDRDYVRAEEVPGVEASASYMVFVEVAPCFGDASARGMSRSKDGFLVDLGIFSGAAKAEGVDWSGYVSANVLLNPASNRKTVGLIRVANPGGGGPADIALRGRDDDGRLIRGDPALPPTVTCSIPPRAAIFLDVADLEAGSLALHEGSGGLCEGDGFGDGGGKWNVGSTSHGRGGRPFLLQGFLRSSTGLLSNVSRRY